MCKIVDFAVKQYFLVNECQVIKSMAALHERMKTAVEIPSIFFHKNVINATLI